MTCNHGLRAGDPVEKDDEFGRWAKAQGVISQGQGRRAWRNSESQATWAAGFYFALVAVLVLVLLAAHATR